MNCLAHDFSSLKKKQTLNHSLVALVIMPTPETMSGNPRGFEHLNHSTEVKRGDKTGHFNHPALHLVDEKNDDHWRTLYFPLMTKREEMEEKALNDEETCDDNVMKYSCLGDSMVALASSHKEAEETIIHVYKFETNESRAELVENGEPIEKKRKL